MKKYVKPELIYERYELSQNIADCAWELQFATKETCMAIADENILGGGWGGRLFTKDQGCYYKSDDGYEEYCYHNGSQFYNVFQS